MYAQYRTATAYGLRGDTQNVHNPTAELARRNSQARMGRVALTFIEIVYGMFQREMHLIFIAMLAYHEHTNLRMS